MKYNKVLWTGIVSMLAQTVSAQVAVNDTAQTRLHESLTAPREHSIKEVHVKARRIGTTKSRGVMNEVKINEAELHRAACCNLGESFSTNPSVDVSYADAATGARQIRLLGLSGTYVQMLTENIPNFRGTAAPYALGYVPGP